jgi:hypothetical protein
VSRSSWTSGKHTPLTARFNVGEFEGLVPDGVASITATMANGAERQIPVHDNFFKFEWAPPEADPTGTLSSAQSQVTWHDAAGAVIAKRPAREG